MNDIHVLYGNRKRRSLSTNRQTTQMGRTNQITTRESVQPRQRVKSNAGTREQCLAPQPAPRACEEVVEEFAGQSFILVFYREPILSCAFVYS